MRRGGGGGGGFGSGRGRWCLGWVCLGVAFWFGIWRWLNWLEFGWYRMVMGSLVISCRIVWVSQMNTMRGRKYKADDHLVRVNSEAFC